jgi:hypothetical protein
MPNVTLQQKLKSKGVSDASMADIQPLLGNKNFQQSAESQIAVAQAAADAKAQAQGLNSGYEAEVNLFITAVGSLREIASTFPEVAEEIATARTALDQAMSKVKYNGDAAVKLATPKPVDPKAVPVAAAA